MSQEERTRARRSADWFGLPTPWVLAPLGLFFVALVVVGPYWTLLSTWVLIAGLVVWRRRGALARRLRPRDEP